jgi:DNA repair protein RAD57
LFDIAESLCCRIAAGFSGTDNAGADADADVPYNEPLTPYDLLDNIYINSAATVEDLEHALAYSVPSHIERIRDASGLASVDDKHPTPSSLSSLLPIRLLVIDSLAAPFRSVTERTSSALSWRSTMLVSLGDKLHRLATTYRLAVVVANQVTDVFSSPVPPPPDPFGPPPPPVFESQIGGYAARNGGGGGGGVDHPWPPELSYVLQARFFSGQSPSLSKAASLGLAWANIVNTRVMLSRTGIRRRRPGRRRRGGEGDGDGDGDDDKEDDDIRRATLVFSPFAPRASVEYVIDAEGVRSLSLSLSATAAEKEEEPRWGARSGRGVVDRWRMAEVAQGAAAVSVSVPMTVPVAAALESESVHMEHDNDPEIAMEIEEDANGME